MKPRVRVRNKITEECITTVLSYKKKDGDYIVAFFTNYTLHFMTIECANKAYELLYDAIKKSLENKND